MDATPHLRKLGEIVGAEHVLAGDDLKGRFDKWPPRDPLQALCIVRPGSTAEVAAVIAYCAGAGLAVITHGGLTGLAGGASARPQDVVLSLERMTRIEEVDPVAGIMVVEAGAPLQRVQEAAEAHELFYPVDIGARGSATIGGNIATNAGGNRVLRFGMTREQVLGLEAVLADGTVVSSMNTMLKNNTGYDLKQLFIGSEGTLGVVTRAVLRLRPRIASVCTALLAVDSFEAVLALLPRLAAAAEGGLSSFEVMWASFMEAVLSSGRHQPPFPTTHPFHVLIEVGSSHAESFLERGVGTAWEDGLIANAVIAQNEAQAAALWAIREDIASLVAALGPTFAYDISLPQKHMASYCEDVQARARALWPESRTVIFGHVGDCNLHVAIAPGIQTPQAHAAADALVYDLLRPLGGSISAEHGVGLDKRAYLGVSRSAEEIALMRRLKAALDPDNRLNPGKVIDMAPAPSAPVQEQEQAA